jgi:hypothetical protein
VPVRRPMPGRSSLSRHAVSVHFALPELASAPPVDGTNVVVVGQAQSRDELDRAAREVVALSLGVGEGSVAVRVTIVESPQ